MPNMDGLSTRSAIDTWWLDLVSDCHLYTIEGSHSTDLRGSRNPTDLVGRLALCVAEGDRQGEIPDSCCESYYPSDGLRMRHLRPKAQCVEESIWCEDFQNRRERWPMYDPEAV